MDDRALWWAGRVARGARTGPKRRVRPAAKRSSVALLEVRNQAGSRSRQVPCGPVSTPPSTVLLGRKCAPRLASGLVVAFVSAAQKVLPSPWTYRTTKRGTQTHESPPAPRGICSADSTTMKFTAAILALALGSASAFVQPSPARASTVVKGGFDGNQPMDYSKAGMQVRATKRSANRRRTKRRRFLVAPVHGVDAGKPTCAAVPSAFNPCPYEFRRAPARTVS